MNESCLEAWAFCCCEAVFTTTDLRYQGLHQPMARGVEFTAADKHMIPVSEDRE